MSERLDAALARRGLARSRTHAVALVREGLVTVDGRPVVKASAPVSDDAEIVVTGADHYVSRGAHKLIAALDAFGVDPSGRLCLDVGASTGGFTQVLLERGADEVVALDVGHDQLDARLRSDARVRVVEGFNVRDLDARSLADAAGTGRRPDLVVGDLSFISLSLVLEPLRRTAADGADVVLLVKPQFEVGRQGVREGIVRDKGLRHDAVSGVVWAAWDAGLETAGIVPSPVLGGNGNQEYLLWARAAVGSHPPEWESVIGTLP